MSRYISKSATPPPLDKYEYYSLEDLSFEMNSLSNDIISLGFEQYDFGLESLGLTDSMEGGVGDKVKAMIAKVKEWFKKVWEWIKNMGSKIFNMGKVKVSMAKKSNEALKEKVEAIPKGQEQKVVEEAKKEEGGLVVQTKYAVGVK